MFLDASALLACLLHEPGQAKVLEAIAAGVQMTTINFAVANGAAQIAGQGVLTADPVWASVSAAIGVPVHLVR